MFRIRRNFIFVVYPKSLIVKGQYAGSKLPQYTFQLYKKNIKEDELTVVPTREQKLYYNYFILEQGKLQFHDNQSESNWEPRRIMLYDNGIQIGGLQLNVEEYVSSYLQFDSKIYEEKLKITENITFQFDVFVGTDSTQISQLLVEVNANSAIKTPLTRQSRQNEDDLAAKAQSLIYNTSMPIPQMGKQPADEDQSANQSINTEPLAKKLNFTIQVRQVPVREIPLQGSHSGQSKQLKIWRQFWSLPAKDKMTFFIFGIISVVMIYLSMFPVKKI